MTLRRNLLRAAVIAAAVTSSAVTRTEEVPAIAPAEAPSEGRPETASVEAEAPLAPLSEEGEKIAEELGRALPAGSEARAMYEDILKGRQMGPGDGWFRLAVAQTRFDWPAVKGRYDRDGDGGVSAEEFGGPAADFARLDRDGDGKVTEADLSWKETARGPDPASMLFRMADADGDGRVTAEEFTRLFSMLDSDGAGFVTPDDLRGRLALMQSMAMRQSGGGPDRETLLRGLQRQEIGSLQPGPGLNDPAPDFTLMTFDGSSKVTLSEVVGPKPVVLVFGNFTCGPFRGQAGNVEKVYRRYKDRATFLMVYVREAHPADGWHMESNERVGVSLPQPRTYEERAAVAARCQGHIKFEMPFLVDTIDDKVGAAYSGMPSRLYVLDGAGKVAYKGGRGPFGFRPAEMEQALILLLNETARAGESEAGGSGASDR